MVRVTMTDNLFVNIQGDAVDLRAVDEVEAGRNGFFNIAGRAMRIEGKVTPLSPELLAEIKTMIDSGAAPVEVEESFREALLRHGLNLATFLGVVVDSQALWKLLSEWGQAVG